MKNRFLVLPDINANWRSLISILLSIVVCGLYSSSVASTIQISGVARGLSVFQISLITAVTAGTVILTSPLWGKMVGKSGSKNFLLIGLVGNVVAGICIALIFENHPALFSTPQELLTAIIVLKIFHAITIAAFAPAIRRPICRIYRYSPASLSATCVCIAILPKSNHNPACKQGKREGRKAAFLKINNKTVGKPTKYAFGYSHGIAHQ